MGKSPVLTALRYRRKVPENQQAEPKQQQQQQRRSSRSPRRAKPRQPKQPPPLLKQLLWKAKAVQPTPASSSQEQEDEEETFADEQRQARKLLASEAQAQHKSKTLSVESSQETQSGSEDEAAFLTAKWRVYEETPQQDGLDKAAATRRKQRQKYKLKQKQKRAAAKEQKRQKEEEKADIFHPPTNLASEMDAGVCRAVLSQLKDVVPFIVVGDVACPVVADHDEQSACDKGAPGSDVAIVDFRQHVIAMLDRSKETQMQYRESFMVEDSGFDAASSYDFFKRRFCEIQRSAGIVYY